jgi:hypothetical protein
VDHDVNYQKSDHGSGDKQKDQIDTSFVDIQLEQQLLQGKMMMMIVMMVVMVVMMMMMMIVMMMMMFDDNDVR